jgi:hypothetical protein
MCVPGTGTDDGGRTVKMVPFYTNADHSLDITTSVQALRQEVEPKSREKRLIIWWPVHITYRILTASHQPNNLFQHKHSHALKAILAVLPNMAPQKTASHADEDASQPAAKRQKAPPGGSGTGPRQSIGVASLRSRTVRKSTQVAAATTTDPLHNSNSTTSENRPISALHGVKWRQRLQQNSARPSFKLRPPTSVALKVKPEAPRVVTNQPPSWSDCNLCWCAIDQSDVPMTKQAIDYNAMRLIGRLFRLPSNDIGRSVL